MTFRRLDMLLLSNAIMVAATLLYALTAFNIFPRVELDGLEFRLDREHHRHGWPIVYMTRDPGVDGADMGGMVHAPWPFGATRLMEFRFAFLATDVVIAILLIGVAARLAALRTDFLMAPRLSLRRALLFLAIAFGAASYLLPLEVALSALMTIVIPMVIVYGTLSCFALCVVAKVAALIWRSP